MNTIILKSLMLPNTHGTSEKISTFYRVRIGFEDHGKSKSIVRQIV